MANKQSVCVDTIGKYWDCSRNTCVNSASTTELRENYKTCEGIPRGENRIECFEETAYRHADIEDMSSSSDKIKEGQKKKMIADSTFLLMSYLQSKGATGGAKCLSRKVLKLASIAGLLSELKMKYTAKSKFEAIAEAYQDEQTQKSVLAYDAQVRAIKYLEEEQEVVKELSKERKTAYLFTAAAYSASSVIAMAETAGIKQPSCLGSIPTSSPADTTPGGDGVDIGGGYGSFLGKFLKSSPGIVMAGVFGANLSYKLSKMAKDQYETSKENIKKVRELQEKFETATAGHCTPEMRTKISYVDDAEEGGAQNKALRCYCYNSDGSQNTERTNSKTCTAFWELEGKSLFVAGGEYTTKINIPKRVCMLKSGQLDPKCKCKQLLDKKNNNACLKVPMGKNTRPGFGRAIGLKSLFGSANALTSGNISFGEVNPEKLAKSAMRNREILKNELKKLNAKRRAKGMPPFEPFSKKVQDRFMKQTGLSKLASHQLPKFNEMSASVRPQGAEFNKPLESMEESGNSKKLTFSGGSGANARKTSNSEDDLGGGIITSGDIIAEPNKDLADDEEYIYDDITKEKERSIWDIVSRRYKMSAVPKLFGSEE